MHLHLTSDAGPCRPAVAHTCTQASAGTPQQGSSLQSGLGKSSSKREARAQGLAGKHRHTALLPYKMKGTTCALKRCHGCPERPPLRKTLSTSGTLPAARATPVRSASAADPPAARDAHTRDDRPCWIAAQTDAPLVPLDAPLQLLLLRRLPGWAEHRTRHCRPCLRQCRLAGAGSILHRACMDYMAPLAAAAVRLAAGERPATPPAAASSTQEKAPSAACEPVTDGCNTTAAAQEPCSSHGISWPSTGLSHGMAHAST